LLSEALHAVVIHDFRAAFARDFLNVFASSLMVFEILEILVANAAYESIFQKICKQVTQQFGWRQNAAHCHWQPVYWTDRFFFHPRRGACSTKRVFACQLHWIFQYVIANVANEFFINIGAK
jgi:hypothetical protein